MKTLVRRRPAAGKRAAQAAAAGSPAPRRKPARLTGEEMMRQLDRLLPQCPPMDTKAFLDDEE